MNGDDYPMPAGERTVAWFHCFAGIAGDMALGSLLDAGAGLDAVQGLLGRLPLPGWHLEVQPVLRGGLAATRAVVTVDDDVVVRTHAHIVGLIEEARLPERVTTRALAVFAALAEVEGRLHRRPASQVHFHEVGGHDTIIDIVGTVAALEVLGVDELCASPVATGLGMVRSAHGLLPNPAPAVIGLLDGIPTWGRNLAVELTTPTGAAILAALSSDFGPLPAMRVGQQGFGAGSVELAEIPNCTQVVIGTARHSGQLSGLPQEDDPGPGQPVCLLEANLDDASGEQLAYAVEVLLEAGAYDAWLTPVIMKKGRPGTVVHVLCDPARVADCRRVLRESTGTFGVRMVRGERWPVTRSIDTVLVDGQPVQIKVGSGRVKAEYDDLARIGRRTGRPLRDLAFEAESRWRQQKKPEAVSPGAEEGDPSGSDQSSTAVGTAPPVEIPLAANDPSPGPDSATIEDGPA